MNYLIADEVINVSLKSEKNKNKFKSFELSNVDYSSKLTLQNLDNFVFKHSKLSFEQNELIFSMQNYFIHAMQNDKLLIHASFVVVDNQGYMFCGGANSGKSTMLNYWIDIFSKNISLLNDDRSIIGVCNDQAVVWSSPWSKVKDGEIKKSFPLRGIAIVCPSEINRVSKIDYREATRIISLEYPAEIRDKVCDKLIAFLANCNVIAVGFNQQVNVNMLHRMMKNGI